MANECFNENKNDFSEIYVKNLLRFFRKIQLDYADDLGYVLNGFG